MNETGIQEQQDYGDDFWPGFVDILSGLILIFSFLILVAGVVIAVIYQTYSTVKLPPTKFTHILAIVQNSPLVTTAQYDIIEEIKRENNIQILVQKTAQQLEDIGERTHRIIKKFPELRRQIVQEINFLQEEINLVKRSPPPEGKTQRALDNVGGRLRDSKGTDKLGVFKEANWTVLNEEGEPGGLFITFKDPTSLPPNEEMSGRLRQAVNAWLNANPDVSAPKIFVANATVPYAGIASKDSLRRVLFLRELMRSSKAGIKVKIISTENDKESHQNGWIQITK